MDERIDMAFIFDDKVADIFTVAALSIAENPKPNLAISFVDRGISEEHQSNIYVLREGFSNINDIVLNKPQRHEIFEDFPFPDHFSLAFL
jgi:hypothetical protein